MGDPSKAPIGPAPAPGPAPSTGTMDTLKLSPNDKTLTLRVYVDNTFSEAYWMGGRVAMTVVTPTAAGKNAIAAVAQGGHATMRAATAFAVKPIWISEAA